MGMSARFRKISRKKPHSNIQMANYLPGLLIGNFTQIHVECIAKAAVLYDNPEKN